MSNTGDERLVVLLEARIRDFERNMQRAGGTARREYTGMRRDSRSAMRDMEQDAVRASSRINQAMATASTRIGAVGRTLGRELSGGLGPGLAVGIGALGTGALINGLRDTARGIADIGNQARRAGLSVKDFQQLAYVAEANRIEIDALVDGMKELAIRADEYIVTGVGGGADAFKRLGYSAEELKTKLREPSDLLVDIFRRLEKLNKAAQIRIADEIFGGTGGERFVELLDRGADGIQQLIKEANDFGLVMDEEMIAKADEVDRKFTLLTKTVGAGLKTAIVEATEALGTFIDMFNKVDDQSERTLRKTRSLAVKQRDQAQARLDADTVPFFLRGAVERQVQQSQAQIDAIDEQLNARGEETSTALDEVTVSARKTSGALDNLGDSGIAPQAKEKPVSAPIIAARQLIGLNENRDKDLLQNLFKSAGQNVDPTMTAWCAAFVNAVLSTNGLKGTGKLNARSFLDYGTATDDPRQGDIVVLKRGKSKTAGHVGFLEGFDEKGNPRILGGNQSDGVNVKSYNRNDVLGYRRIPGAERIGMVDGLSDEIARRTEAAELAKAQADAYSELIAGSKSFTAEQAMEMQALGMTAEAAARLRYEQQLLNEATSAGLELTPQQRAQIGELAQEMANAEVATARFAESQQAIQMAAAEWQGFAGDTIKGFVSDLRAGKDAGEAFAGVLERIADKLIDMAIDNLFASMFQNPGGGASAGGGGGVGGGIGSIVGTAIASFFGGGRASGGEVQDGKFYRVGEKGEEWFAPGRTGTIIPNHNLPQPKTIAAPHPNQSGSGSRSETFAPVYQIDARGSQMSEAQFKAILAENNKKMAKQFSGRGGLRNMQEAQQRFG